MSLHPVEDFFVGEYRIITPPGSPPMAFTKQSLRNYKLAREVCQDFIDSGSHDWSHKKKIMDELIRLEAEANTLYHRKVKPLMKRNPHPNEAKLSVQQGLFFLAMERQITEAGLIFEYDVRPATQWKPAFNEMYIAEKPGPAFAKLELIPAEGVFESCMKVVHLGYIGVATYVRRQGFGKRLMQMIANAADEAHVNMWLSISPDYKRGHGRAKDMLTERQLQKFYAKYGFVSTKCNWKTMGRVKS